MVSLQAYQQELKKLLFFHEKEPTKSFLWKEALPDRLHVYRNNTRSNWSNTVDHDFPLTKKQFSDEEWETLRTRYFIKHPPQHWELNSAMVSFVPFLKLQKIKPYIKELADFEWHDLKIFIDRANVKKGAGVTNPTALIRAYQHQIFYWVEADAPIEKPPLQKPEVLVFYRDSKNTSHILEADPLMILLMEHFRKPHARWEDLEAIRLKLLPENTVALATVADRLKKAELIL